jgi:hypothetical protein
VSSRWAFLVGACQYEFHPSLKYAATDATRFAHALETSLGFDRKRMLVLADSNDPVDYQPTRRDIFHSLGLLTNENSELYVDRQIDPIAEDDLFVFYFSGHGIRRDRDEFLLPVESSKYSITETAVPLDAVVECIEKLPCRQKVLFLDACREELYQDEGAKAVSGAKGIGQTAVVDREGLATFYSCDPGQRSYEIDELKHGAFTYCLLEAIKHPEINTLGELDDFLKSRVPQENVKGRKEPQQPFSVPNPADMLQVDLFRLTTVETDRDQLMAMTNKLFEDEVLDYDGWERLYGVWEAGDSPNFGLKKAIFERFYTGGMPLAEFEAKWQRAEKYSLPVAEHRPDLPIPAAATSAAPDRPLRSNA